MSSKKFLKYLGGKTDLCGLLNSCFPNGERLVEPFCGSCSVFLNSYFDKGLMADSNKDIINLYHILQSNPYGLIDEIKKLFVKENNTPERYDELRTEFNRSTDPFRRSCIFVYFNRHSYNGLCRYNDSGEFNSPFGAYESPVCPVDRMIAFSNYCKNVEFFHGDFKETFDKIKDGDVVYCDPPYVPLTESASFVSYGTSKFRNEDQEKLVELVEKIENPVIISNNDMKVTRDLYRNADEIITVGVRRSVSCDGDTRNDVAELLALYRCKRKTLFSSL